MANKRAACLICGEEYDVCRLCPSTAKYTPWRTLCDSVEHYKIYLLLSEYDGGVISKEDACEYLTKLKISEDEIETFIPSVKKTVKEILSCKKETKRETPKNNNFTKKFNK